MNYSHNRIVFLIAKRKVKVSESLWPLVIVAVSALTCLVNIFEEAIFWQLLVDLLHDGKHGGVVERGGARQHPQEVVGDQTIEELTARVND